MPVSLELTDLNPSEQNPLPAVLPEDVFQKDGFVLLLLFRSAAELARHTERRALCRLEKPVRILFPGWKAVHVVNLREAGDDAGAEHSVDAYPVAVVSRPRDKDKLKTEQGDCPVAITIRGTFSTYEWKLDLSTQQSPVHGLPNVKAHSGFLNVANAIFPSVSTYVAQMLDDCDKVSITVTGEATRFNVDSSL